MAARGRGGHVLITVNTSWNVWNFRRALVAGLIADGWRVSALAPPDETVPRLEAAGCRMLPLAMDSRGLNPIADLALMARLARTFRREAPDVVLGYTIKNNVFGAMAARVAAVPFLPNVSGLGTAFLSGGALQRVAEGLYRHAFRPLPAVFFQNADDRALFLSRGLVREGQARLLPGSGIDLDHFAPAPMPQEGPPVFLLIARMLRDKGVVEFVQAARMLRAERPDLRFQLLGATGIENRSAIGPEEVAAWVAEGVVEYLGPQADVRPFLRAAHCVVLPSYREGAPRTLIEASAMARPVIATDVPGCRAVVARDETGLMCAPRSAESLADAIRRFLALPSGVRAAMGLAARRKMEQEFDQQIVIDAYRAAIAEVTGRM